MWKNLVYFNIFKSECEFVTKVSQVVPVGCRNFPASGVKFDFKPGYHVWVQDWFAYKTLIRKKIKTKMPKVAGVIDNPCNIFHESPEMTRLFTDHA